MENGETFMYLSARTLLVTHGLLTCLALALLGVIASAQDTGASAKTPTLFLIGDSTVRNGAGDPGRPDPPENFKIPASPMLSEVKPPGN